MLVQAYINFNGNCREAVEFYSEVFNTEKPQIMSYGDMPPNEEFPIAEETKNLVMHAEIKLKESTIMFSDNPPDMPLVVGNNITLIINSKDMDEIKSMFNKMKLDGNVVMEIQETFWSKCYGYVIDKYGIGWQFSYQE
jgi:PhnB protein